MVKEYFRGEGAGLIVQAERPLFGPTQVLGMEELQPGKRVAKIGSKLGKTNIEIVGQPFQKEQGSWCIKALEYGHEVVYSLSDMGVMPYENGLWHKSNWTEDPSKVVSESK